MYINKSYLFSTNATFLCVLFISIIMCIMWWIWMYALEVSGTKENALCMQVDLAKKAF